jgi:hypothetical protein
MNEPISDHQAAQLLDSINQSRAAMRRALRPYGGHWYLWTWGAMWLAMAILGYSLGCQAVPFINGLVLIGTLLSLIIAFVQSLRIRVPIDRRFLAALCSLAVFGYPVVESLLWPLIPNSPEALIRAFAYATLVAMQGYILAGIWFRRKTLLWIGIGISGSILLGVFAFSSIFWLWFAVFAAVPLILSGFYVRYFMPCKTSYV